MSDRLAFVKKYIRTREFKDRVKATIETERLKCNFRAKVYVSERRKTDPDFVWRLRYRTLPRNLAKSEGRKFRLRTHHLVGCSPAELRVHLESLFTDGMTWELLLAGEIEIDHIRPCVTFDLSKLEEVFQCCRYTNLQPLWVRDNRSKNSLWNGKRHRK
jgi:hypothetical protein